MSNEDTGVKGPPARKTPWSVLITAAVLFVACGWLWNELRKDAEAMKVERETDAVRARANESSRPKILGLDVIPQETKRAAPSAAAPSASASSASAPSASAPP